MLRVLDLFSGIGGFSLGLRMAGGFETVQFVEIDHYCQRVLAKNFPGVPIHADIRTYQSAQGSADLVCGGFPCQPFSHAGKQRGKADDRDLWPEMRRVIAAVRPAWVIGENVAGFVTMELDSSLSDLAALGYACQALVIPACAVDAPHRRDRVWIVAQSDCLRLEKYRMLQSGVFIRPGATGAGNESKEGSAGQVVGHAARSTTRGIDQVDTYRHGERLEGFSEGWSEAWPTDGPGDGSYPCRWEPEPGMGRVAHGIPSRVDRLRGLGNAVVPQVVAEIGRAILMAAG